MAVRRRRAGRHSRVRLIIVRTGNRLTVLGAGDTTQRAGVISANLPCIDMRSIAHNRWLPYQERKQTYCRASVKAASRIKTHPQEYVR
jgi:hypothetical protein